MPSPTAWSRLRQTRLVQALVVYLAGAWVAAQAVSLFSDAFGWPDWVTRGAIVVLAAGLVATLVLVGAHSRAEARAAVAEGEAPPRSRPLLAGAVAISLVIVGAALWFVVRDRGRSTGPDMALANVAGRTCACWPTSTTVLSSGDSASAQGIGIGLRAIQGRAAIARGEPEEARAILEPMFRESGFAPAAAWLAQIHTDAGRDEEAVAYLETFGPNPWLGPWLGSLYDKLGERDKALEAYGWTTVAWDRADPVLQPRVAEARSAVSRLRGLQRG
jgi:hypothetical protein